jgi:hypothetical protein
VLLILSHLAADRVLGDKLSLAGVIDLVASNVAMSGGTQCAATLHFMLCCWPGCRHVAAGIRVNMVVALADLASRFPNVLEPWTDHIYQTLAGGRCLTLIQTGTSGPPYTTHITNLYVGRRK